VKHVLCEPCMVHCTMHGTLHNCTRCNLTLAHALILHMS